ncbi:hypothetical protein [Burkholderia pseudomallei]|uniref:hypothetical protein n=1 Tax=Burkholderia pseudomallei TaxID=28450 RepID=UPI000F0FAC3B|nr:hypothetical protein [Burkholderia pseudomallei]CAJ3069001.1 Uncharacterised protein [Burkholderia pseudomallei]VCK73022.1 Uncharacterised protein [Burkholderia pseudomallei]VCK79875.1 Uncharacterised protein [Burkholderia pseudomallei]VCK80148.1 Uncharacterised protein [Burkholderia pseudomallei]VCK80903.1 Uncharacterised protein [Burkholderia pseudomallei]
MKYKNAFLLVFAIALASPPNLTYADSANLECLGSVAAGSFGGCLDSLNNKLQALIQSFENSGNALEAGIGGQIATNIALARSEFGAELTNQMNAIGAAEQNFVVSTSSQIQQLEGKGFSDARKLTKDVLDTASAIPFSRRDPSVRPISNPYYVPLDHGNLIIVIDGHFVDSSRNGYQATLQVDGSPNSYVQSGNSTDQLQFSVPYSALARKSANPNSVEFRHISLNVPYQGNQLWCVFAFMCKNTANFKFDLITLPQSPGQIVVTKSSDVADIVTQKVTTPEADQDSKDNDIEEDKSGKLYCYAPRDAGTGWRIQPATVKGRITMVIEGDEGKDWWWVSNPDSATSMANACVRMQTLHKGWPNHSGKVKFVVDYTEEHDSVKVVNNNVRVNIGWGGSQVIPVAQNETWTAVYKQFDGRIYNFADGNIGTPFLNINVTPAAVTLSAVAQSQ